MYFHTHLQQLLKSQRLETSEGFSVVAHGIANGPSLEKVGAKPTQPLWGLDTTLFNGLFGCVDHRE